MFAKFEERDLFFAMLVDKVEASSAMYVEIDKHQAKVEEERSKLGDTQADAAEAAWWKRIREDDFLSISDSELTALELNM